MYHIVFLFYLHGTFIYSLHDLDRQFARYQDCQRIVDQELPYINTALLEDDVHLGADKVVAYCTKVKPKGEQ